MPGINKQHAVGVTGGYYVDTFKVFYFDHSDFDDADSSDTVTLAALSNIEPQRAILDVANLFAAPTASAITLQVGDSDADGLVAAVDVLEGSGTAGKTIGDGADAGANNFHSSYTLTVTGTLTDDNWADTTAGSGRVIFFYRQYITG